MKIQKYSSDKVSDKYDVIIIGSGISGLCSAAILGMEGKKVLVLEKHFKIGGYTHTFKRQGYEWDVGIHYIGGVHRKKAFSRRLFDKITENNLKWNKTDDNYDRIVFPDKSYDFIAPKSKFIESMKNYFPNEIVSKFGMIGAFGPTVPIRYGGGGLDYISYGLIMQEIERGDSGMRSTASVQGSLVMYPINAFGSEEQKKKYLPKLASGKMLGCFGLTEANHGSNPSGMESRFEDKGDHYLLNGAKMWISNAPHADIAVVWAKDEKSRIHGLIVERGMEGFTTPETHGKWSLRASCTGELVFSDVKVPKENLLLGKKI